MPKKINIPFHKPEIDKDLFRIMKDSIESGWLTTGPKVTQFESILKEYLNAKHVIALNSCTAALHIALLAKNVKKGDKVIVPTYTFVATSEVLEYIGAEPIFVDSELNTFNIDINQVEYILKKDSSIKGIIPVHFAGQSINMDSLIKLKEKFDLFVIEDCAHALETVSSIGKVGDTSDFAAFSFYANKNITTGGEGGALSTNNSKLAEKARILSLHGMSKDGWKRFKNGNKWQYDVEDLGYKYNMTDISASFGLSQLKRLEEWSKRRLNIVKKYNQSFSKIEGMITPNNYSNSFHAWHLYIIRVKPEFWKIDRSKLINLINEKGIGTSVHYKPIHMHTYYIKKYGFSKKDFPNSYELSNTVITLPLYPKLTNDEIDYIISSIEEIWKKNKI